MRNFQIRDAKLRTVTDSLEKGNLKKALTEVNKCLKKNSNDSAAKMLKALTLLKSGKAMESASLANETISQCPVDETSVNAILSYLHESGEFNRETEYLTEALKKDPNREDLLVNLFLNHVQMNNLSGQQSTARLLTKSSKSRLYTYWVIVSTISQADDNPHLRDQMYLPLAEKLLIREVDHMQKHDELNLLLELLSRLGKHADLLSYLDRNELIERLGESDYRFDYTRHILQSCTELDLWDRTYKCAIGILDQNPNDWDAWKSLIQLATKSQKSDPSRLDHLLVLIERFVEEHPSVRGPQLARLDLYGSLIRSGSALPTTGPSVSNCLQSYFTKFASKPVCSLDLAYLIGVLIPEADCRSKFLETLVSSVGSLESITPIDVKTTYQHLCAYQIARANRYPICLAKLLRTYFTVTPERVHLPTPLPKNVGDEEANASAVDLAPSNGFLLIALSHLLEQKGLLKNLSPSTERLGLSLLTAYWSQYLGLVHASNDHHFRLRLCSLFAPYALGCPDLSLAELKRLDVKQLLFVSLGQLIVTSAPMLTLWANRINNLSQPEEICPMVKLYQQLVHLSRSTVNETKDALMGAYQRGVYTKIREFTLFADRLRHADIFLLARMELVYWQVALILDNFDSTLEFMGSAEKELNHVSERLEHIVDCRDFKISPNFDPESETTQPQEVSFKHLVHWIRLRLYTVSTLRHCARLVMDVVILTEQLLSSGNSVNGNTSKSGDRVHHALDYLEQIASSDELSSNSISSFTNVELNRILIDVSLPAEQIFTNPAQLPPLHLASLYLHGPFCRILKSGVTLLLGVHGLLTKGLESFPLKKEVIALDVIRTGTDEQFSPVDGTNAYWSWSDFLQLSPPNCEDESSYFSHPSSQHPGSLLLFLGVIYESIALSCMFLSMAGSMLRPRNDFLIQSTKRNRRKAAKSQKKSNSDPPSETNNPSESSSTLLCRLDGLGAHLLSTTKQLQACTNKLADHVDLWTDWATKQSCADFFTLTESICAALLPEDLRRDFPILIPDAQTGLFEEISLSYRESFNRVASGLRMKAFSLSRIQNELQNYDPCVDDMKSCQIDDQPEPTK